jgi:hypothetical protein
MVSQVHSTIPGPAPLLVAYEISPPCCYFGDDTQVLLVCFTPTSLQKAAHSAPENGGPLYEEISMGSPNRETQLSIRLAAQLTAVVLERRITSAHLVDLYCCKNVRAPLAGRRERAHEVTAAILAVPAPPRDVCCQTKWLAIILLEA